MCCENSQLHTDVDECLHHLLNNCTYKCVNTIGSYYCICEFWYSLEADGKSCVGKLCKLHSISHFRIHAHHYNAVSAGKIAGITVGLLIILLVSPLIVLLGVYTSSHWHQKKQYVTIQQLYFSESYILYSGLLQILNRLQQQEAKLIHQ